MKIAPQAGPQTQFLSSPADLVIYGGARGGGKTFATLLEPLRHINTPGFNAVIFRRTYPQITNAGGLWDKSQELYPMVGGIPSLAKCQWEFPSGATIAFRHLKLEEHKIDWQGLQICLLMWEELTHFSKSQFIFLMGSNRSTCGVKPYIRATCNPDADSWVKELIAPYLCDDGYVNLDEVGKIKHFIIEDEQFKFVDEHYRDRLGLPPKSFTYINADVWDNAALLEKDPGYLQNLMAQSAVDRDRFLGIKGRGGNWNARAAAGKVFKSEWLPIVDAVEFPYGTKFLRFWDRAATLAEHRGDDPDWTVGIKLALLPDGDVVVMDVIVQRVSPDGGDRLITETAHFDGMITTVGWFQDPGQAGVYQSQAMRKKLKGFSTQAVTCQLNKFQRAKPFSAACEHGEVKLLKGQWNQGFICELVGFPDAPHDDQVDAASGGYNTLSGAYDRHFTTSQYRSN
jgi:predicted phage terminase large subunit-like protein